jgi:hypothetical protein
MKQLMLVIEAPTEAEIIAALLNYGYRAEETGCYSAVTEPGPKNQGLIATYKEDAEQLTPGMRDEIMRSGKVTEPPQDKSADPEQSQS